MNNSQVYMPVNWVDGMKINKLHLTAERNALQQQIAFTAGSHISAINYGLLPAIAEEHKSFKVFVNLDNQQHLQVRLVNCRAITAGGAYINIDEDALEETNVLSRVPALSIPLKELKSKSKVYYAVLSINVFDRIATGNADVSELPPRLPYAAPQYHLALLPEEDLNGKKPGLYHLIVSRVLVNENTAIVDEDYIPPCSSVASHPDLLEIFYNLEEFMSKMELYAIQINQRIQQKKQNNDMAVIVQNLCEQVLQFLQVYATQFKWQVMHEAPCVMLAQASSLARLIKNGLDVYIGSGKEELMNYFAEWCDVSQANLEKVSTELSNHVYKHEDINQTVIKVADFTKVLSQLFYKLGKLDYIGKKKDANIFVKEEIVAPADTADKKRRSFLAD